MRIALIKNGFVANVVESALGLHSEFLEVVSDSANVGDSYDGQDFVAPYVEPVPPVIEVKRVVEVSNVQARAALKHFGYLPTVLAIMDSLAKDDLTRMAFELSPTVRIDSPTTLQLAGLLELDDAGLYALFEYADGVKF
jgi:hypothetical protein